MASFESVHAVMLVMVACGLAARGTAAAQMVGHTLRPERRDATEERIRRLKVPAGFAVDVFARDLGRARILAVAADGTVYVSRPDPGDVLACGTATVTAAPNDRRPVLTDLDRAHGLAIVGGRFYVAGVHRIVVADIAAEGRLGEWRLLVEDLPDGGQHARRTIGVGPDGLLYISVGSSCNACDEANREHATLLRMRPEGSERTVGRHSRPR